MSGDKERLVESLVEARRDLQRLCGRRIGLPLLRFNLTMPQLKVLLVLDTYGSTTSHDLTRDLRVSSATVTGIIDRLVAQHLVGRHEDEHDRRVRRIELTDRGRTLVEHLREFGDARFRELLRLLDADELRALERIMAKLLRGADGAAQGAPSQQPEHTRSRFG